MKKLTTKSYTHLIAISLLLLTIFCISAEIYAAAKPKNIVKPNKADAVVANKLRDEADKYYEQNQYEKAIPLYLKLIAIIEKANILVGAGLANDYSRLAYSYREIKEYQKSEAYYLKAIAADENEIVIDHPALIYHFGNLGLLYVETKNSEDAEEYFTKSLREKYDSVGSERRNLNHIYTAIIYENLADIYLNKKQFQRAQANYDLAIQHATRTENFAKQSLERLYNKSTDMLLELGLIDDSIRILEHFLIPLQEELWGEDDYRAIVSSNKLASLYTQQKSFEKAETLSLKSIALLEKKTGGEHFSLAQSYGLLASIYVNLGLYNKAETYYLTAIRLAEKNLGPEDPDLAEWNYHLGVVYFEQGLVDKAEPVFFKVMTVQEQVLDKDDPKLAFTYTRLAHIYQHKKIFAKAEPLFLKAVNITLKNFSNANENSKVAVENYIHCVEVQGKPTADLKIKYGFNSK